MTANLLGYITGGPGITVSVSINWGESSVDCNGSISGLG